MTGAGPAPARYAPAMTAAARARLALLAAAALFSSGGAIIKSIELGPFQVACLRSLVAAAALLLLLPDARKLKDWRPWVVGAAFGSTMILFVLANKLTTAANAIYLQSTAPLYLIALSPLVLRERASRADLGFLLVLAAGLTLFFVGTQAPQHSAPDPARGNLLAALSGLTWALTLLGLRFAARGGEDFSTAAVAAGSVLAFAATLPLALPLNSVGARDAGLIAFLGVFQIGLAYLCLNHGIARVKALEASLLLLLEPVLNPLWAFAFHGEVPGSFALAGCALILFATATRALRPARA